jgi:anti-sigma regulatory factor (Ser/Thr protein kinase)
MKLSHPVPARLDEAHFSALIEAVRGEVLDLREVQFFDPAGMLGVVSIGRVLERAGERVRLLPPRTEEVRKYLERMDCLKYLARYFEVDPAALRIHDRYLRRSESPVLLEITEIRDSRDVLAVVTAVKTRVDKILKAHLRYDDLAVDRFAVALSEICQNIPDHSQDEGLVAIQRYYYESKKQNIVKIAASDCGIGIRESLTERYGRSRPAWNDAAALALAFEERTSRFFDEGRGNGLKRVKDLVLHWKGRLAIRSGTARLVIQADAPQQIASQDLPFFPGTQISIFLPEIVQ